LAVTVFHPVLLVSQFVLPVRPVLVTKAALAVPRLQTPRSAKRSPRANVRTGALEVRNRGVFFFIVFMVFWGVPTF